MTIQPLSSRITATLGAGGSGILIIEEHYY
jgi:hypothetical protein